MVNKLGISQWRYLVMSIDHYEIDVHGYMRNSICASLNKIQIFELLLMYLEN